MAPSTDNHPTIAASSQAEVNQKGGFLLCYKKGKIKE